MNIKKTTYSPKKEPWEGMTYKERLIASKAIDLRDNHTVESLGNGHIKVHPIDKNKLIK